MLEEDGCKKKEGLAYFITVLCTECDYKFSSYTSKTVQPLVECSKGMKPFEVNIRTVYALRSCSVGHTGLGKFCCMMNMPAPMTVMNYNNISNRLRDAAKIVAENSMKDAVVEAKQYTNVVADIGVSVDGTWQRMGDSSLNGVVVAISIDTGKIVVLEVLTRYCRQCVIQNKLWGVGGA